MTAPARVLIAKVGLDGHDRGAKVVAMGLRDAGFEVIYTGIRQRAADVVRACIEEDVGALGLSSLSGGHMANFADVVKELKKQKVLSRIHLFAGGVIPPADQLKLRKLGFFAVYPPGTSLQTIVADLTSRLKK
ncbi:cobalamin B12-binding domain-containing protein [bacterium]|nr:cobalamin B12-binding domain-containing protein [bacterium]